MVVCWHASRYFAPYGTGWSGALFSPGGAMGVDLFFLISGFIMVVTTRGSDGSAANAARFMIRRFARIWPLYAISTMMFLILFPWRGSQYTTSAGLSHLVWALCFIPLQGADSVAPTFGFPPLPVGWTLNYEMYFYLIFAVSLLFGRMRWIAFATWLAVTLWAMPRFLSPAGAASVIPSDGNGFQGYLGLITNPLILQFAAGVAIGIVYQSRLAVHSAFYLKLAMFLTVSLVVFQFASHLRVDHGISQWGLSLIPLVFVFSMASKAGQIGVPRALVHLGDISFSLYMFHPMVQEGFDYFIGFAGHDLLSDFSVFFITTALAIATASISQRYLELGLSGVVRDVLLRVLPSTRPSRPVAETRVGGRARLTVPDAHS